ncbi:MAG: aldolase [Pirellulaceae bacterium]|nr:aldolase [Pirellulaceae bacterium]
MNGRELAQAFRDGKQTFGTAVLSPSPKWVSIVKGAGLDFVFIDTEHTPMDREKVAWMCEAFRAVGVVPIVRIPVPDPFLATMALDAGALGVVGPYVETASQITALRGAVKCRPLKGQRLEAFLNGESDLAPETKAYLAEANRDNLLIVNIESTPALENLENLVNTPGLDGVFVGPHDLSISLGVPEDYGHPTFLAAVEKIIVACRKAQVGVGIHLGAGDPIQLQIEWAEMGANILVHSSDIRLFAQGIQRDFIRFREATGTRNANAADSNGDHAGRSSIPTRDGNV